MRVLFGSVLFAGALLLSSPLAAYASPADDPIDLAGSRVVDAANALNPVDVSRVETAITKLETERGVPVFVVFVDDFDGASDDQEWANETAIRSGLLDTEVLLAISTESSAARWSVADGFSLDDDKLAQILNDDVLPAVRDGRYGDAAVEGVTGMNDALAPSPVGWIIAGVVVVGAGSAGAIAAVRRRRARKAVEGKAKADAAELERRAGTLLVELDDALKTSEQELGFAQAQFGEAQTKDFSAALAEAKATAKQAFEIRQKLDDAFPETPDAHRIMTLQLIELAEKADATLDAQADAFDALRELERNAPQVLEGVAAEHKGLADRITAAEATIAGLHATHPDADLSTLKNVPAQARKLTAFAKTAVDDATAELQKPDGEAAVAVRAAQQAVGQVAQLLGSVDTLAADLAAQAEQRAAAASQLETATQTARSAITVTQDFITTNRGAIGATARTRISEAERHLAASAAAAESDPATALSEAEDARRLAGAALIAARADVSGFEEQQAVRDYGRSDPIELERNRYEEADGASLGGILADLFFGGDGGGYGGRSSSSSSGGWSWGGSSGGGSSWSSSRPSGFGGSSRRSSSSFSRGSSSSRRSSSSGRGSGRR
jgi:hypothetical protein